MGSRYIGLLIVFLFFFTYVAAGPTYQQGTDVTLSVPCTIDGEICSAAATCVGTVLNPDDLVLYNNASMVRDDAVFELDLNSTDTASNGEYRFSISCTDGNDSRSKNLVFEITPNGELPTTGKSIVDLSMLLFLIALLVFSVFGIFYIKDVRGKLALYWVTHLLAVAVSFIAWQTASGTLSATPFVGAFFRIMFFVLIIAFLPMFFISIAYIIKHHFINKNTMDLINAGYDSEDAERIALKMAKND